MAGKITQYELVTGLQQAIFGTGNIQSGINSHAEGTNTQALSNSSHSEGYNTISGRNSTNLNTTTYAVTSQVDSTSKKYILTTSIANAGTNFAVGDYVKCTYKIGPGTYVIYTKVDSIIGDNITIVYSQSNSNTTLNFNSIKQESLNYSHAEGNYTQALGIASHSEGNYTQALGLYSHAEGSYTTASGYASHTEGGNTIAQGEYAHAEGKYTQALGKYSHVEGDNNIASGDSSHSEGSSNTTSGYASHAEGSYTTASGYASHAEGSGTTASGDYSHTEGYSTQASNVYSHAEGNYTQSSGIASHAEGNNTQALGDYSHAEGLNTIAGKQTINFMPTQAVYDAGMDLIIFTVPTDKFSLVESYGYNMYTIMLNDVYYNDFFSEIDEVLKQIKFANMGFVDLSSGITSFGLTTVASNGSHSEGSNTTASGVSSHAEGSGTNALGDASHAEGNTTQSSGVASHAEGNNTLSQGYASHAEGNEVTASGYASHAEGNGTRASNTTSHAEGDNTTSSGVASHAEGGYTQALGDHSHVEGYMNMASTARSHAEGRYTLASHSSNIYKVVSYSGQTVTLDLVTGLLVNDTLIAKITNAQSVMTKVTAVNGNAVTIDKTPDASWKYLLKPVSSNAVPTHAEGSNTIASGNNAHAEGSNTVASGICSHTEGLGVTASGNNAHAEGSNTIASGNNAHAEGDTSVASGNTAHAQGNNTVASGDFSHASGLYTVAQGHSQTALGRYNVASGTASSYLDTDLAFIVGIGTNTTNRVNGLEMNWKGDLKVVGSLTDGFGNKLSDTLVFVNAKGKGIKGDGSDETSAIQSLLNSVTDGTTLYFPKGNYSISSTLTIPANNVTICGDGLGTKFTVTADFKSAIHATSKTGIVIRNIYLYGKGNGKQLSDNWGTGVILQSCTNSTVTACRIENFGKYNTVTGDGGVGGVWLRKDCTYCEVSNNYITECNNGINEDCYEASSGGSNYNLITKNFLVNCRAHIISDNINGLGQPTQGATITDNVMVGHHANLNGVLRAGIISFYTKGQIVSNNKTFGCVYGIYLDGYVSNINITGNVFHDSQTTAIASILDNSQFLNNFNITGNTISGASACGISLYNAVGGLISNNNIVGTSLDGILLNSTSNINVSSNRISSVLNNGININGSAGQNIMIHNNLIEGNSSDATNSYSAISINSSTATITARGNVVNNPNTSSGFQYGINVVSANKILKSDNVVINARVSKFNPTITAPPSSGTWDKGDIILNDSPTASGYMGWVCVTSGTPGTWKGYGAIQA